MIGHLIQPEIKALIEARDFTALHKIFKEWPPETWPIAYRIYPLASKPSSSACCRKLRR